MEDIEGTFLKERIWDTLLTSCRKEALPAGEIRKTLSAGHIAEAPCQDE